MWLNHAKIKDHFFLNGKSLYILLKKDKFVNTLVMYCDT